MAEEIKLKINKEKIIHWIPYIILGISTILGIYLVSPLFKEGVLMNVDAPFHYAKIQCLKNNWQWSIVTAWCPNVLAGVPLYQNYSPLGAILTLILSAVFSLEFSYKLVLVFAYFLLPFAAFLFFYYIKNPLAGSFAYAFLLLEHGGWDLGGFEQIFLVQWPNSLGLAFFLLSVVFAYNLFENPNKKNLLIASITASLLVLSHVMHFIFLIFCIVILGILFFDNVKKNIRLLLLYPFSVFMITGFYIIPFIAKSGYFGIGSGIWKMEGWYLQYYIWAPLSKFLVALGIIGFVMSLFLKVKKMRFISLLALFIPALYLLSQAFPSLYNFMFITKYLYVFRLIGELRIFLFLLAAFALASISKIKMNNKMLSLKPVSVLVFLIVAFFIFNDTLKYSSSILLSGNEAVKYQDAMIPLLEKNGNVLVEDTLHYLKTPQYFSHSFSPWSGKIGNNALFGGNPSFLALDNRLSDTAKGNLFNEPISNITKDRMSALLNTFNIKYVVAFSNEYVSAFSSFGKNITHAPWTIFETNVTRHYFEIENGSIESESYLGLNAKSVFDAKETAVVHFKISKYPNWVAKLDGNEILSEKDEWGLMKFNVNKGRHELELNYGLIFIDYVGYLITLLGIIFLIAVYASEIK